MDARDAPKLRRVKRLDSIRLDKGDSTYFTEEGYLVDHPILTSCGIFEYTNPDGSIRRELRLPEHVFDENSLKTYRGKPIIITHEAGVVDKTNVDREQIGTILSDGYQDGEDVRAEIIIHDTDAMKESGLKELSLGYNLDLLEESGTWQGEPYDAIQTNIVINHLALVASARAGEQARLNIDGSDEPTLKGGKLQMSERTTIVHMDGSMTPEELQEAINEYKAKNAGKAAFLNHKGSGKNQRVDGDGEETTPVNEEENSDSNVPENTENTGSTPADIAQIVKERRAQRTVDRDHMDAEAFKSFADQQDEEIDMLLAALEKLIAENTDCGTYDNPDNADNSDNADNKDGDCSGDDKEDSSDDESKSLNADSADEIFRQRLTICRIGDKLHMDGLENMSIKQGKKAIIAKVLPNMRMDGKSDAYIDAMFDLAVGEANKHKNVEYQRQQMTAQAPKNRTDSNESMAASARKKMIEREGGNE